MALQLRSLVRSNGELELSLADVEVPTPKDDEVVIRIDAAPLNPSDLGLLLAGADLSAAETTGTAERPVLTAQVPERALVGMKARLDQSMPVGNEGAGVVVAAGSSPAAQALLGKTVGAIGGAMYAQYRAVAAAQCLVLPEGTSAADGASSFVNPVTALGMTHAMRRERHTALVHTAAASNLGQMLVKLCLKDGIPLVNIVRKEEQVKLLRDLGAEHVCNSSAPTFFEDLVRALVATGATLAFDAIGGGNLVSQILNAMEAAINQSAAEYSRYGSNVHKQVYLYGGLDRAPTELIRGFGMAWGIGGWLIFPYLQKIGLEEATTLRQRVAGELKTTFASTYTKRVTLQELLQIDVARVYAKQATGEKVLLVPAHDRARPS